MTRLGALMAIGCVVACGCTAEPTAPAMPSLTGRWYLILQLSGSVQTDSATATCEGVVDLTLTQSDSLLSGPYVAPPPLLCRPRASTAGWFLNGFPAPFEFNGVISATGDLRLGTGTYPDSLGLVGRARGDVWGGTSTYNIRFYPGSDTTLVLVPLAGNFTLVRPVSSADALPN